MGMDQAMISAQSMDDELLLIMYDDAKSEDAINHHMFKITMAQWRNILYSELCKRGIL